MNTSTLGIDTPRPISRTMSDATQSKSKMTPLWIIALFLSLAETVASLTTIYTTGGVQIALTAFVATFPTLVAGAFFAILWNRPYVLYPPTEYGKRPSVGQFVDAMRQRQTEDARLFKMIEVIIKDTLTSDTVAHQLASSLAPHDEATARKAASKLLDSLAQKATDRIQANVITIDASSLLGARGAVLRIPYDPEARVCEILESVYYFVSPKVEPYSFGRKWTLIDAASGRVPECLLNTCMTPRSATEDRRTLRDVGLKPGARLIASLL